MFLLYLSPLIYLSFLPYGKPSGMGRFANRLFCHGVQYNNLSCVGG